MKTLTIVLIVAIIGVVIALLINLKPETRACTLEYAPVCGIDGRTYGNSCMAGSTDIVYPGECDLGHLCTAQEKSAEFCTLEYNPVCGNDNITYGNGCAACSNDVDYWIAGECLPS